MASNSALDWAAVGVAYVFSLITTIILFALYIFINRRRRRKKKWQHSSNRGSRDILRDESMRSTLSTRPLTSSVSYPAQRGPSRQTSRQVSVETEASQKAHTRRNRDYVQKWCNENNLPETVANVLRDKGFITPQSLTAIKPADVQDLGLPNKGMECLLRQVLEDKEQEQRPRFLSSTSSRDSMIPVRRSSSEERSYTVVSTNPAGADIPLLNKSSSAENCSDSQNISFQSNPISRSKKSMDSLVLTDIMPPVKKVNGYSPVYNTDNHHRFNGLLSNPGLHRMSSLLGREWTFLATQLNISHAKLDHIKLDHPNDTKQQIYHMLCFWRDHQSGTKEQIKGTLGSALSRAGRVDLFDLLMQEQVDGSVENLKKEVSII